MSTRLSWLLGLIVLISVGLLMACGSHYSTSSDGLVIVPSQGSASLQAFSFNLSNGKAAKINTAPAVAGTPTAIVLDPAGAYAYVAYSAGDSANSANFTGALNGIIAAYKVNSDGTLLAAGSPTTLKGLLRSLPFEPNAVDPTLGNPPVELVMDSTGKFLFVADTALGITYMGTDDQVHSVTLPGTVSVFSIGGSASLTEVSGSPFTIPATFGGTTPNPLALATTATSFPAKNTALAQNASCAGSAPPTTEFLYVADSVNHQVWAYPVDMSSGVLGSFPSGFPTGTTPSGVAVDPCNRFVYVTNQGTNQVSGYRICEIPSVPDCPFADGSLVSVGPPAQAGNGPTAIVVDPFGNFVYVVDNLQNAVSAYKISSTTGILQPLTPALVSTGQTPVSIAIRADDNWLFVTNRDSASVSQYAITPATGALAALPAITTDNFPWGTAVK